MARPDSDSASRRDKSRARLFVEADLAPGKPVVPTRDQAHYLLRVMRLRAGDELSVFNGRDGEWRARLEAAGKQGCALEAEAQRRPQRPEPDVWLAFAPLKKARMDVLIEKATELGAAALWPVFTRRTVAGRVNTNRLRAQAIEAAEQCERLTVPEIRDPLALDAFLDAWPPARPLIVLDETGNGAPITEALAGLRTKPRTSPPRHGFLIGPEGGFARSELDALANLPFVMRVGAGPRILRSETAALAALTCWQALIGDWCRPS